MKRSDDRSRMPIRPFRVAAVHAGVAIISTMGVATAGPLLVEPFDYPPGKELGEPSSAGVWENDKSEIRISAGNLEYEGLAAPTGNHITIDPANPNPDGVRTVIGAWPEQFSGTLYLSFILRIESISGIRGDGEGTELMSVGHTSNSSHLFGINLIGGDTLRIGVVKRPSSGALLGSSVFFSEGAGAELSADGSTDYLVVAKYEWVEGDANDKVALWINPTTLGTGEDMANKIATSTGDDGAKSAGRLTICRGPHVRIDELRLGQSWAEVTPPAEAPRRWWTMVALAGGLAAAFVWIAHLLTRIRERSAALRSQIEERRKAEQERMMERERARIARDLHDELGADITEISMLATRARATPGDDGRLCMEQVEERTRNMVAKLEEIVWAMNPKHDSLGALVDYLTFFADRFLGLANIKLAVASSDGAADLAVEARERYQLFLVFREALANVVRHAGATEVRLSVRAEGGALEVEVADNGSGQVPSEASGAGHEGISNMRRRIEKLGGRFEISGDPGHGTTVRFSTPLNP